MSHFFALWLHHSHNFPSGLTLPLLGVPLFAVNRIGKICLLVSALVILLEIMGTQRIEDRWKKIHQRSSGFIARHQFQTVVQELFNTVSIFLLLFRTTFRKDTTQIDKEARRKVGPVFRTLGGVMLACFALSAVFGLLLGAATFLSFTGHAALGYTLLFAFFVVFFTIALLCILITITAFLASLLLWIAALLLRPLEITLKAAVATLFHKVNDKGAAHSWRVTSVWLLLLGFLLDFMTS